MPNSPAPSSSPPSVTAAAAVPSPTSTISSLTSASTSFASDSGSNSTGGNATAASHRSSSAKRKGVATSAPTGGSSSHILRTTSTAAATAAAAAAGGVGLASAIAKSDRSTNSPVLSASNPAGGLIAPPPRVALGSSSSSGDGVVLAMSTSGGGGLSSITSSGGGGGGGNSNSNGSGSGSISSNSSSSNNHNSHNSHINSSQHFGNSPGIISASAGTVAGASSAAKDAASLHLLYTAHHHHSTSSPATAAAATAAAAASMSSMSSSSTAIASASAKDLRIAQLERELEIMEREFTRELDKLSKAESETATYWQAKHARLQQQLGQAEGTLRLLRAEVDLREAERAELRAGWEEMQQAAAVRDDEVRALRAQVRGLKEWVSASTRADAQVASDEVFADGMARLANGLQNWVITHFRRASLVNLADPDGLGPTGDDAPDAAEARHELARLVPMYRDLLHSAKLHLLQSVVSRLLVELVFSAYFAGLPADLATQLAQMERLLVKFAGTAEPVNQWRALTLAMVKKDAAHILQAETARMADIVVARVNAVLDAITTTTTTNATNNPQHSDTRDQALRALVTDAMDLSRLLSAQKAVFRVVMPEIVPHQRLLFDPATMEDMGGEDDEGLVQREIACVTFPGIIKHGDETGGHLQYQNIIYKARVLCSPE